MELPCEKAHAAACPSPRRRVPRTGPLEPVLFLFGFVLSVCGDRPCASPAPTPRPMLPLEFYSYLGAQPFPAAARHAPTPGPTALRFPPLSRHPPITAPPSRLILPPSLAFQPPPLPVRSVFGGMKAVPARILGDRALMQSFSRFSEPIIRLVDRLVGATNAMRVDAYGREGQQVGLEEKSRRLLVKMGSSAPPHPTHPTPLQPSPESGSPRLPSPPFTLLFHPR